MRITKDPGWLFIAQSSGKRKRKINREILNVIIMSIGIIGLGNIGEMLLKRFVDFINPKTISVFDVEHTKLENISKQYKVKMADSLENLTKKSDYIFICVKPQNLIEILKTLKGVEDKVFVSTVAAIYEDDYYKLSGKKLKLIRIIPSMINKIGGPILFLSGKYVSKNREKGVEELLLKVGNIYRIKEKEIDCFTHLTSCSPAIIANFVRLYIESMSKKHKIDEEAALSLMADVMEITAKLLKKEKFGIISQVCTNGGITELGIKILEDYKKTLFKDITSVLLKRMEEIRKIYGK